MAVQITIVGLGQIGASVGLALAEQKELVKRVGHDRELRVARAAEKLGAVDKVALNLPGSVRDADIVLLALPTDQIRETMELIAADLKEAAVVMDTAPVKEAVAEWAREILPPGRHYVGLTPVLNPAYLHGHESGVEAAHADLFRGGLMAIVVPHQTASEAVKLAADLTRLLGATPLFADPMEVDGFMAATHILPQLMAAALLNITVDQPGWLDGRKMAGRAFAEVTGPVVQLGEPGALCSSALLTQDNVVRVIDSAVAALIAMRNDIKNKDQAALSGRVERARSGRERWWKERQAADWANEGTSPVETPKASEVFGRLLGMGGRRGKK
jgi:prephenate dehydrogenase